MSMCTLAMPQLRCHVCVVNGMFEAVAGSVIFHLSSGIDEAAVAQVQATLRCWLVRAFVVRGTAGEFPGQRHAGLPAQRVFC
jgi:hypothetical protein